MNNALSCTQCDNIIIKSIEGELKVRAKVLVFKENQAFAICKGCNSEIPVPLVVDMSMMKSITSSNKLRLYIKK